MHCWPSQNVLPVCQMADVIQLTKLFVQMDNQLHVSGPVSFPFCMLFVIWFIVESVLESVMISVHWARRLPQPS